MMKNLLLFALLFVLALWAQSPQTLSVSAIQKPGEAHYVLNIAFGVSQAFGQGVIIETDSLKAGVPRKVRIGDQQFWLKKSSEVPQSANSITWQQIQNGILLRFPASLLDTGQQIEVEYICLKNNTVKNGHSVALFAADNNGAKATQQPLQSVAVTSVARGEE